MSAKRCHENNNRALSAGRARAFPCKPFAVRAWPHPFPRMFTAVATTKLGINVEQLVTLKSVIDKVPQICTVAFHVSRCCSSQRNWLFTFSLPLVLPPAPHNCYETLNADDHGLMVIFHGCTVPRGWERMYPNYVGSEAVLASENLIFNQHFCDEEAFNACLHPFIRNAVGIMFAGKLFL